MTEQATLGGGCYWCFEALYQRIEGIEKVESGYSGGTVENPTSEQVYMGGTGHAEVVQLTYDPAVISFETILEIFFVFHDPTTLNRQAHDVGDEYRSIIFYRTEQQKQLAQNAIETFAPSLWKDPIVTQLEPFSKFWPADEYIQDFYNKNPNAGYCQVIIDPKIQKLRQKYSAMLKPT